MWASYYIVAGHFCDTGCWFALQQNTTRRQHKSLSLGLVHQRDKTVSLVQPPEMVFTTNTFTFDNKYYILGRDTAMETEMVAYQKSTNLRDCFVSELLISHQPRKTWFIICLCPHAFARRETTGPQETSDAKHQNMIHLITYLMCRVLTTQKR